MTPGQKFRQALLDESPLQIPGTINANQGAALTVNPFNAITNNALLEGTGSGTLNLGGTTQTVSSFTIAGGHTVEVTFAVDVNEAGANNGPTIVVPIPLLRACSITRCPGRRRWN